MGAPKPYPSDQIINENLRIAKGWAHVEVRDRRGNLIKAEDVMRLMPLLMLKGGIITYFHTNRKAGQIIRYGLDNFPGLDTPGVWIEYVVDSIYDSDNLIWEGVKTGALGLSWAGHFDANEFIMDKITNKQANLLDIDEAYEVALAPIEKIINPYSTNFLANMVANADAKIDEHLSNEKKNFEDEKKKHPEQSDEQILKSIEENEKNNISHPMGPYKDFAACVEANKDKKDPDAYCATIMREVEGKNAAGKVLNTPAENSGNTKKGDVSMEGQPGSPAPAPASPTSTVEERLGKLENAYMAHMATHHSAPSGVKNSIEDHTPNKIEPKAGSPASPTTGPTGAPEDKTDVSNANPSPAPKVGSNSNVLQNATKGDIKNAFRELLMETGLISNAQTPLPSTSALPAQGQAPVQTRQLPINEKVLADARAGKPIPTWQQLGESEKEIREAPLRAAMESRPKPASSS